MQHLQTYSTKCRSQYLSSVSCFD